MQRLPEAETAAKKSVTLDAKSAHAHDLLGQILTQKGEVAQACTEFETALKLEPTLGSAQLDLADILMRQGQARAATALLERATHSSTADVAERAHAMLQQLRPH